MRTTAPRRDFSRRGLATGARLGIELPACSAHLVTEQVSSIAATAPTTKDMMMTTNIVRLLTLGVAATATLTAAGLAPATAAVNTRTAVNQVSWVNGKVVHTFAGRLDKKPWCKKGSFCFWSGEDFKTEPPLTQVGVYLKCNEWMDLGRHGFNDMMSSVWNNTGSRVNLINHDDHGKRSNGHRYDKTLVRVQQGQVLDSLGRYNKQVDHVKRFC